MKAPNQQNTASAALQVKMVRHEPPSDYVTQRFYDWLGEISDDLKLAATHGDDVSTQLWRQVSHLLVTEARLLDQQAFTPWLDLYVKECAYWIPSDWPARDPRKGITLEFHDRRRLLDRIARLDTGVAYSQFPPSRTSRQWSGLELWASPTRKTDWHARYNFTLVDFRSGQNRLLAGWNGFVLRETDAGLGIVVKQINLIDCDRSQGNNSFFL
jgi:3-phenylpropionate/cinnamic acid dioxygenase small subunit